MTWRDWSLLTSSALLFSVSFLFSYYAAELVFIFLVPLYYVAFRQTVSFWQGFVWGIVAYSLLYIGIFELLLIRGNGPLRFVAVAALLIYAALCSGLWFGVSYVLVKAVRCQPVIWLCTTWLYFGVVDRYFFWFFGEGNPFHTPVLPLAERQAWLWIVQWIPVGMILLMLVMWSVLITLYSMRHQRWYLYAVGILVFVFVIGWFVAPAPTQPDWAERVVGCTVDLTDVHNPYDAAMKITYRLSEVREHNPQVRLVVLPESSFPFALNHYPKFIEQWCQQLPPDCSLVIGAHHIHDDQLHNSAFFLHRGLITKRYDKLYRMFLTEKQTEGFPCFNQMFLTGKQPFCRGSSTTSFSSFFGNVQPLICSELFFRPALIQQSIIIALVNDSWFGFLYVPRLMLLRARLIAREHNLLIIYCSQSFFYLLT